MSLPWIPETQDEKKGKGGEWSKLFEEEGKLEVDAKRERGSLK
jgi:hypothetical protein